MRIRAVAVMCLWVPGLASAQVIDDGNGRPDWVGEPPGQTIDHPDVIARPGPFVADVLLLVEGDAAELWASEALSGDPWNPAAGELVPASFRSPNPEEWLPVGTVETAPGPSVVAVSPPTMAIPNPEEWIPVTEIPDPNQWNPRPPSLIVATPGAAAGLVGGDVAHVDPVFLVWSATADEDGFALMYSAVTADLDVDVVSAFEAPGRAVEPPGASGGFEPPGQRDEVVIPGDEEPLPGTQDNPVWGVGAPGRAVNGFDGKGYAPPSVRAVLDASDLLAVNGFDGKGYGVLAVSDQGVLGVEPASAAHFKGVDGLSVGRNAIFGAGGTEFITTPGGSNLLVDPRYAIFGAGGTDFLIATGR